MRIIPWWSLRSAQAASHGLGDSPDSKESPGDSHWTPGAASPSLPPYLLISGLILIFLSLVSSLSPYHWSHLTPPILCWLILIHLCYLFLQSTQNCFTDFHQVYVLWHSHKNSVPIHVSNIIPPPITGSTNHKPVSRSRVHSRPIRGQYSSSCHSPRLLAGR